MFPIRVYRALHEIDTDLHFFSVWIKVAMYDRITMLLTFKLSAIGKSAVLVRTSGHQLHMSRANCLASRSWLPNFHYLVFLTLFHPHFQMICSTLTATHSPPSTHFSNNNLLLFLSIHIALQTFSPQQSSSRQSNIRIFSLAFCYSADARGWWSSRNWFPQYSPSVVL